MKNSFLPLRLCEGRASTAPARRSPALQHASAFAALTLAVFGLCSPVQSSAQDAILSADVNEYNVVTYGAKGNGTTDDAAAIQKAINAAVTKGSGVVVFPAGNYLIKSQLTMTLVQGIAFQGAGKTTTTITAGSALSGKSMIFLTNCAYCAVRDMTIRGTSNSASAPLCAIETNVNHPPCWVPTHLYLEHLNIGAASYYLQWGVRWTCVANDDQNNEMAYVFDCVGSSTTKNADFYIGHINSEIHRFVNCQFNAPIGIQTFGGSVIVTKSIVNDTQWFIDFESSLWNYYNHPSFVSDCDAGSAKGGLFKSTADALLCSLMVSHFNAPAGLGNGSAWISWAAPTIVTFSDSFLNPGTNNPVVTAAGSTLTFKGCTMGIHNIQWGGRLSLQSNTNLASDLTLVRGTGALLFETGNTGPTFTLTSQGWN